jgi:hypothetical protein
MKTVLTIDSGLLLTVLLALYALAGCSSPAQRAYEPAPTSQPPRTVNLELGMKASEVIPQVCPQVGPITISAVEAGANMTIRCGGYEFVFSEGVLKAAR